MFMEVPSCPTTADMGFPIVGRSRDVNLAPVRPVHAWRAGRRHARRLPDPCHARPGHDQRRTQLPDLISWCRPYTLIMVPSMATRAAVSGELCRPRCSDNRCFRRAPCCPARGTGCRGSKHLPRLEQQCWTALPFGRPIATRSAAQDRSVFTPRHRRRHGARHRSCSNRQLSQEFERSPASLSCRTRSGRSPRGSAPARRRAGSVCPSPRPG